LKETKEARLEAQKSLSSLQQKLGELNTKISQLKEKRDSAYLKYEQFKDELEEELERIVAFVEEEGLISSISSILTLMKARQKRYLKIK